MGDRSYRLRGILDARGVGYKAFSKHIKRHENPDNDYTNWTCVRDDGTECSCSFKENGDDVTFLMTAAGMSPDAAIEAAFGADSRIEELQALIAEMYWHEAGGPFGSGTMRRFRRKFADEVGRLLG